MSIDPLHQSSQKHEIRPIAPLEGETPIPEVHSIDTASNETSTLHTPEFPQIKSLFLNSFVYPDKVKDSIIHDPELMDLANAFTKKIIENYTGSNSEQKRKYQEREKIDPAFRITFCISIAQAINSLYRGEEKNEIIDSLDQQIGMKFFTYLCNSNRFIERSVDQAYSYASRTCSETDFYSTIARNIQDSINESDRKSLLKALGKLTASTLFTSIEEILQTKNIQITNQSRRAKNGETLTELKLDSAPALIKSNDKDGIVSIEIGTGDAKTTITNKSTIKDFQVHLFNLVINRNPSFSEILQLMNTLKIQSLETEPDQKEAKGVLSTKGNEKQLSFEINKQKLLVQAESSQFEYPITQIKEFNIFTHKLSQTSKVPTKIPIESLMKLAYLTPELQGSHGRYKAFLSWDDSPSIEASSLITNPNYKTNKSEELSHDVCNKLTRIINSERFQITEKNKYLFSLLLIMQSIYELHSDSQLISLYDINKNNGKEAWSRKAQRSTIAVNDFSSGETLYSRYPYINSTEKTFYILLHDWESYGGVHIEKSKKFLNTIIENINSALNTNLFSLFTLENFTSDKNKFFGPYPSTPISSFLHTIDEAFNAPRIDSFLSFISERFQRLKFALIDEFFEQPKKIHSILEELKKLSDLEEISSPFNNLILQDLEEITNYFNEPGIYMNYSFTTTDSDSLNIYNYYNREKNETKNCIEFRVRNKPRSRWLIDENASFLQNKLFENFTETDDLESILTLGATLRWREHSNNNNQYQGILETSDSSNQIQYQLNISKDGETQLELGFAGRKEDISIDTTKLSHRLFLKRLDPNLISYIQALKEKKTIDDYCANLIPDNIKTNQSTINASLKSPHNDREVSFELQHIGQPTTQWNLVFSINGQQQNIPFDCNKETHLRLLKKLNPALVSKVVIEKSLTSFKSSPGQINITFEDFRKRPSHAPKNLAEFGLQDKEKNITKIIIDGGHESNIDETLLKLFPENHEITILSNGNGTYRLRINGNQSRGLLVKRFSNGIDYISSEAGLIPIRIYNDSSEEVTSFYADTIGNQEKEVDLNGIIYDLRILCTNQFDIPAPQKDQLIKKFLGNGDLKQYIANLTKLMSSTLAGLIRKGELSYDGDYEPGKAEIYDLPEGFHVTHGLKPQPKASHSSQEKWLELKSGDEIIFIEDSLGLKEKFSVKLP